MFVRESCPVCGSRDAEKFIKMSKEYLYTAETGCKNKYKVMLLAGIDYKKDPDLTSSYWECRECGLFYLKNIIPMQEAVDQYAKGNKDEREKHFQNIPNQKVRSSMDHVDSSLKMISLSLNSHRGDDYKVLDYGCGGGIDLAILKSFRINTVVGYDIDDKHFDFIKKYIHNDIILTTNTKDLERYAPFDAIRCNSVLEHVYEPNEIVKHIYSLLKKGGVVFFAAPCVSRNKMKQYKKLVDQNIRCKTLHLRHTQLWNSNKLSLPKYIQSKGFKIIPYYRLRRSLYGITSPQKLITYLAYCSYKGFKACIDASSTRMNKPRFGSFFAVKL